MLSSAMGTAVSCTLLILLNNSFLEVEAVTGVTCLLEGPAANTLFGSVSVCGQNLCQNTMEVGTCGKRDSSHLDRLEEAKK